MLKIYLIIKNVISQIEDKVKEMTKALQDTQELPCQGVIVIEEGRAYVYEHYNY